MGNKSSVTSVSFPTSLSEEIEKVAEKEHKTKSGVIQDAVRQYLELRKWQKAQSKLSAIARKIGISNDDDIEVVIDGTRK